MEEEFEIWWKTVGPIKAPDRHSDAKINESHKHWAFRAWVASAISQTTKQLQLIKKDE
jgi:hypothetical protein